MGFGSDKQHFSPVKTKNIPPFFSVPIDAGMTTLAELRSVDHDGQPLLDVCDVADMNEVLMVRYENERRANKAAERKNRRR